MSRHMTTTAITCICRSCLVAQSSLRMPSCVVTASRVSLCTHDIKSSALVYACVEMQSHDNCNTCVVTAARVSLCSDWVYTVAVIMLVCVRERDREREIESDCVVVIMYLSIHKTYTKHTQNIHNNKCIIYTQNIHYNNCKYMAVSTGSTCRVVCVCKREKKRLCCWRHVYEYSHYYEV